MGNRQRFYIYGRKEVGVLLLLGTVVAIFAFTLGVHLGKKVGLEGPGTPTGEAEPLGTTGDKTPGNQELAEQQKNVQEAAEETLNQSLHDEVAKRGVKLDVQRQIELPKESKKIPEATAEKPVDTTGGHNSHPEAGHGEAPDAIHEDHAAHGSAAKSDSPAKNEGDEAVSTEDGKFSIQVGSYPSSGEANAQSEVLEKKGLHPFSKEVTVPKIGVRYRLFVGKFKTKAAAEDAAKEYKSQGAIKSYVIGSP